MKKRLLRRNTRRSLINYAIVIIAYVLVQALAAGGNIKSSLQGQLVPICAYVVMAVSLNLVVGVSGELSLGHAGFMSIGAFTGIITAAALQSAISVGWIRLVAAMLVGAALAGLCGLLVGVPVLRLQGDYLAIVTLAFGEIVKSIMNILYVGIDEKGIHIAALEGSNLHLEEGGVAIIKGPMGAVGVTKLASFTAGFLLVLVTLFIVQNLVDSRAGRAILALRDNRIAAESVGLSVTKYKLMAFVTSAALAGAAGGLYGLNYTGLVAKKFDFNTSILVLVFVVLGGMGNIRGSIIAAALLTILPEALRQFADYRMLVYAIVLILVMLATNNPTMKQLFASLRGRIGRPAAEEGKEETAHE